LQQRGRPEEVVRLFEQNPQLPYTANGYGAVAASYLVLKQPEKAATQFQAALSRARHDDPKVEWQIGLAYAQLESGKYKAASKTIADAKNATRVPWPTRLPAIAASIPTTCRWPITRP
jgi:tetratricopeptide (TPR) repeat protein